MSDWIYPATDETLKKISDSMTALVAIHAGESTTMDSWEKFQALVRSGVAESIYPVGTKLTVNHSTYGNVDFVIAAYDHNPDPTGRSKHSVTLLSDNCPVSSLQFDGVEALYYAESELQPGTYNFTLLAGWDTSYGGGKTLQFTTTKPIPAGGQIMFNWAYNTQSTDGTISTYKDASSTTAIEDNIKVSEGSDGTSLGTADGKNPNMNHNHRARYGNNNWRQSAMRQFLNSKAAAGSVWTPNSDNKFDRPPTWVSNTAGWMAGLPDDFLNVVGEVEVTTKTNTVFEIGENPVNSSYVTRDKFWLASVDEVGFASENGKKDGSLFPLFEGATNADRIKYNSSNTARYWWLRSPDPSHNYYVRGVNPSGELYHNSATSMYAVAPACVIY